MPKKSKTKKFSLGSLSRNDALFDKWSIVHFLTGIVMGWLIAPVLALILMVVWEPLEIFILSPLVAKQGIVFGYEDVKNSLSDIVFDAAGVFVGYYYLTEIITPPIHLF